MAVAILFPGQGSQFPGMADAWMDHPAGKAAIETASNALGWSVVERSREPLALEETEVVQPAVFACDVAAFEVLRAVGVLFDAAAGHSLGEYAALVATGALTFEDGLAALSVRAREMGRASKATPGTMTALLGISLAEAADVCDVAGRGDVLAVANENGPMQTVLSGSVAAVDRATELARSRGARTVRLQVAGAFHSPLMEPALQPVREALSRLEFHKPTFTLIPNASGKPTLQPIAIRDLLSRHLISPVRWDATMRAMKDMGIDWFVEAGPGDVLSKLARRAVEGSKVRAVGSPEDARSVAEELRQAQGQGQGEGQEAT